MKFEIEKINKSIVVLMRRLGYSPKREDSFIRRLGPGNYPRFHLFIEQKNKGFLLKLHLDQKKASYSGTSSHSGEYAGEILEKEKERIVSFFKENC